MREVATGKYRPGRGAQARQRYTCLEHRNRRTGAGGQLF
jgi:hypothetical protein